MTDKMPLTEDLPTSANSPYGQTKLMIEQILQDLAVSDQDWSISLLRYFNPVGAHESGTIGENPKGIPNNLMPYITQVALGKLPGIKHFRQRLSHKRRHRRTRLHPCGRPRRRAYKSA